MVDLPEDVRRAYHDLADDPKFQHFVRIPDRIIQCIDYFGIACDHAVGKARLHAYYLFIGVVDDAIDSGRTDVGRLVLEYLSTASPMFDDEARLSDVRLITEILKYYLVDETYITMMVKLRELYREVVRERNATSIDSYIEYRKSVGALTAELSYLLIRPDLNDDSKKLRDFMKQVGAIGCLVDSLIDLSADNRLGLLGFKPGLKDYTKLVACILSDGLRLSLKHLSLSGLFLRAIVDNIRDRFRTAPETSRIVSDRKSEAPIVA